MKLLAFIFILSTSVMAKSKTGLEVMQMVDKANKGFGKETSQVKMVLRNAHGQEATREMKIKNFEMTDKNNHGLIEFFKPRDYKGTKLLTHQRHDDDNLQWLFLSRFKRVKQIHSGQQSGPFMGSEFSYEDIAGHQIDKFKYKLLKESKDGDDVIYRVEQIPTKKNSGYTKMISDISNNLKSAIKVDYYDRKGDHLKTMTVKKESFKGFEVNGKTYWRSSKMVMVNHQTKKSSVLETLTRDFKAPISKNDLTPAALKK